MKVAYGVGWAWEERLVPPYRQEPTGRGRHVPIFSISQPRGLSTLFVFCAGGGTQGLGYAGQALYVWDAAAALTSLFLLR